MSTSLPQNTKPSDFTSAPKPTRDLSLPKKPPPSAAKDARSKEFDMGGVERAGDKGTIENIGDESRMASNEDTVALGCFSPIWDHYSEAKDSRQLLLEAPNAPAIASTKIDCVSDGSMARNTDSTSLDGRLLNGPDGPGRDSHAPNATPMTKFQETQAIQDEQELIYEEMASNDSDAMSISDTSTSSIEKNTPTKMASAPVVPVQNNVLKSVDQAMNKSPGAPNIGVNSMVYHDAIMNQAASAVTKVFEQVKRNQFPDISSGKTLTSQAQQPTAQTPRTASTPFLPPPSQNGKAVSLQQTLHTTESPLTAPNGSAYGQTMPTTEHQAWPLSAPNNAATAQAAPQSGVANTTTLRPSIIQPMTLRTPEERHFDLMMRILNNFPGDHKPMLLPMNLISHNNDPSGIHVFIDASNIIIGFLVQLKGSRNLPRNLHLPMENFSFGGLALVLERRRSVAKRVLVGSTPNIPAYAQAKAIGYDCSILTKVRKSRHDIAPRQTTALVEQGVDETLTKKMLESIVDTQPPATMVLATGDGAAAEYGDGFLKTVKRALNKGWTVELYSWSRALGQEWEQDALRRFGARFRILYLDDYVEDLLEM